MPQPLGRWPPSPKGTEPAHDQQPRFSPQPRGRQPAAGRLPPHENDAPEAPASAPQSASGLLHIFGLPENERSEFLRSKNERSEFLPGKSNTHAFRRLYAAGPPAEVLLYVLAPERLVGWTAQKRPQALAMLNENTRRLRHQRARLTRIARTPAGGKN